MSSHPSVVRECRDFLVSDARFRSGASYLLLVGLLTAALPARPHGQKLADKPVSGLLNGAAETPKKTAPETGLKADKAARIGRKVMALRGVLETGEKIDLLAPVPGEVNEKSVNKRWTVVYFWSTGCPCVRNCQTLSLFPLYRKYAQRGDVRFYAIASNNGDFVLRRLNDGSERAFLRQSPQVPPYPIVLDNRHLIADAVGASSTPQCFLIGPDNRILFSGNPDDSEEVRMRTGESGRMTRNYLGEALADALSGRAIRQPLSPALGCDIERRTAQTTRTNR